MKTFQLNTIEKRLAAVDIILCSDIWSVFDVSAIKYKTKIVAAIKYKTRDYLLLFDVKLTNSINSRFKVSTNNIIDIKDISVIYDYNIKEATKDLIYQFYGGPLPKPIIITKKVIQLFDTFIDLMNWYLSN